MLNNFYTYIIKSIFPILACALILCNSFFCFGQYEAEIGNGTTTNTGTSYPAPYGQWYYGAKHQFSITASELSNAGIPAGALISEFSFYVDVDNAVSHNNFQLGVYQSSVPNPIANGFYQNGSGSFSNTVNYDPVTGWNEHNVSPFVWDGTSDLVIETCFNNSNYTTNARTRWTTNLTGTDVKSRWYRADNTSVCASLATTGTSTTTRPNIKIGYNVGPKTYVPDDNFEAYLEANGMGDGIADNDSVYTSAISDVQTLEVSGQNISDLTGIEDFSSLISLDCGENQLTSLNVSNNNALSYLDCYSNQLTSLDLSNNVALEQLLCYFNQFTSLDFSNNVSLETLLCNGNQLISLNVSNNILLEVLNCSFNSLSSLDLTNNSLLNVLYCLGNSLESLDVSTNEDLLEFGCDENQISSLNLSNNVNLQSLSCSLNQLTELNLSNNADLGYLACNFNQLTSLDLSLNPNLQAIACGDNQLAYLDLRNGNNTNCEYFSLNNPNLTCVLVDAPNWCFANWMDRDAHTTFSQLEPTVFAGEDIDICEGEIISLNASGSTSIYTWDNAVEDGISFVPTFDINQFVVTGSTPLGCTAIDTVIINVYPLPLVNAGEDQAFCEGNSTTLTGSGVINLSWDNGITDGVSFIPQSGIQAYTLTGTDGNGCSNEDQLVISVYALPDVFAGNNQELCDGEIIVLNGVGAPMNDGHCATSGGTSYAQGITNFSFNGDGDDIDNTSTANGGGQDYTSSILATASQGSTALLNVSLATAGSYEYAAKIYIDWNRDDDFNDIGEEYYMGTNTGGGICSNTNVVVSIPGDASGYYKMRAISRWVSEGTVDPCAASGFDGEREDYKLRVTVGISYSWNNGVIDGVSFLPNLGITTYSVTGTDANGCENTDDVSVLVNPLPAVEAGQDQTFCEGTTTVVNGAGATSYAWDNEVSDGVDFFPPLGTNIYSVVGTDLNGCSDSDEVILTVHALPDVFAGASQSICEGDSVILSASGANSYTWSNGEVNGQYFVPTSSSDYVVTGTDTNGCSKTDTLSLILNGLPNVNAGNDTSLCINDSFILNGNVSGNTFDAIIGNGNTYDSPLPFGRSTVASEIIYTSDEIGASGFINQISFYKKSGYITTNGTYTTYANVYIKHTSDTVLPTGTTTLNGYTNIHNGLLTNIPNGWNQGWVNIDLNTPFYYNGTDNIQLLIIKSYQYTINSSYSPSFKASSHIQKYRYIYGNIGSWNTNTILYTLNSLRPDAKFNITNPLSSFNWSPSTTLSNDSILTPYANPNSSTDYILTAVDSNSCTNSDTVNVTVNPLPNVIASSLTACDSDTIALSGSGASIYNWNQGVVDGQAFVVDIDSVYVLTGIDSNSCANVDTADLIIHALPIINAGPDESVCTGDSVTLIGTGAVDLSWDNGISDGLAFAPIPGTQTFTVTGTDDNGCNNTDEVILTVYELPNVFAGSDQELCNYEDLLTLSATGAETYEWTNNITDGLGFLPNLGVTTYSVTGTDANGCENTDDVSVLVNPLPAVEAGQDQTFCEGTATALSASGATTYFWDNGVNDGIAFIPIAGSTTYTVVGTDVNGCQNTDELTITVNALPPVNAGSDVSFCIGNSATLSGSGANTYEWDNGINDGVSFIPPSGTETYTVTGTDNNGCNNTDEVVLTVHALPDVYAGSDQEICFGTSTSIKGSGVEDPFIYSLLMFDTYGDGWNGNSITILADGEPVLTNTTLVSGSSGSETFSALEGSVLTATWVSGSYTSEVSFQITDASGTFVAGGDFGGTINYTVPGSGSGLIQSYLWDNGVSDGVDFTPSIGATTYTVVGTDDNGCQNTDELTIIVNPLPEVEAGPDQISCEGIPTTVNGAGVTIDTLDNVANDSFVYSLLMFDSYGDGWNGYSITILADGEPVLTNATLVSGSSGSETFTVLEGALLTGNWISGSYPSEVSFAIVDQNGSTIYNGMVNDPVNLTVPLTVTQTYIWDNGISDGINFVPPVGTNIYSVVGTDINGCQNSDQLTILVNPLPNVFAGSDLTLCEGESALLSGSGAMDYDWSGGVADGNSFIPNTGTNLYQVVGTDDNGCSNSDEISVVVNPLPIVSAGPNQSLCIGNTIVLVGSGASSYEWNNGVTDLIPFQPGVGSQNYTLIGTDGNGCQNTDQVNVTVFALPNVNAGIDQELCEGASTALQAVGAVSYAWDNNAVNGASFVPDIGTSQYTVTGTDINGCVNTDDMLLTVYALPDVFAGTNQQLCNGESTFVNATGAVNYQWNNGLTNGSQFTPPQGTTVYTVEGTDANGCSNSDQLSIQVNAIPIIDAGINQSICDGNSVILFASGTGTLMWSQGVSNGVPFVPPLGFNTYNVSVVDVNGCFNTDEVSISVNPIPTVYAGVDIEICEEEPVTLNASGAQSYTWSGGVVNNIAFVPPIGNYVYTVTGTTDDGCSASDQVEVLVNSFTYGVDSHTACDAFVWMDGIEYTQSNNSATYILTNSDGCDSIVTLNLTMSYQSDTTLFVSSLGVYSLNGQVYSESGTYVQQIQNQYGCDSTIYLQLNMTQSGIDELGSLGIRAYPNPFSSILHLDFEQLMPEQRLVLTDINGKVLLQRNNLQLNNVIQLNDLESGMYYINLFQKDRPIGQLKVIRL